MTRDETIKLTIKSLLEVVQTGAKNIEISIMDGYNKVSVRVFFPGLLLGHTFLHELSMLILDPLLVP